jgi:type I site-specific restriction endonuclease
LNLAFDPGTVATEADVELKVITPLLTNPNFLDIPTTSIKGKAYLAPAVLDKKANKTRGYYPDFSVWELGFGVLVVEAKEPEVPVEVGFREASLYARHLNADYQSGINPCHFVLACNGKQLAYGAWDTNKGRTVEIADLRLGSNELESLIRFCHHRVLVAHAAKCLSAVRLSRSTQPYTLAGGQALINSKKAFNSFAAELAPTLRRYFTSTTQNNDPDIYERIRRLRGRYAIRSHS